MPKYKIEKLILNPDPKRNFAPLARQQLKNKSKKKQKIEKKYVNQSFCVSIKDN